MSDDLPPPPPDFDDDGTGPAVGFPDEYEGGYAQGGDDAGYAPADDDGGIQYGEDDDTPAAAAAAAETYDEYGGEYAEEEAGGGEYAEDYRGAGEQYADDEDDYDNYDEYDDNQQEGYGGCCACCDDFRRKDGFDLTFVIIMNLFILGTGVGLIVISVPVFTDSQFYTKGLDGVQGFISASPYIWSIVSVITAAFLIIISLLAIVFCQKVVREELYGSFKVIYTFYVVTAIFFFLVVTVMCVMAGVGFAYINNDADTTENGWFDTVTQDPQGLCGWEINKWQCAGYKYRDAGRVYDCQIEDSTTANFACPGHLCVDFCRVGTSLQKDPNNFPNCKPCISQSANYDFPACKTFERANFNETCQTHANDAIQDYFVNLMIVTSLAAVALLCGLFVMTQRFRDTSCGCC